MRERDRPVTGMRMFLAYFILALVIGGGIGYYLAPEKVGYTYPTLTEETEHAHIHEEVEGLTTLVYGAMGSSLIAAFAAIVSLMQVSRRMS